MSQENNIQQYSAADIERYHTGLLSAKEMHAMEKAALDDPFLADAMEGYAAVDTSVHTDLQELQTRLHKRVQQPEVVPLIPKNSSSIPWLRIAAMIILLAGAAFLTYQIGFKPKENTTVAEQNNNTDKESAPVNPLADTITNSSGNVTNGNSNIILPSEPIEDNKKTAAKARAQSPATAPVITIENSANGMASYQKKDTAENVTPGIVAEQDALEKTAKTKAEEDKNRFLAPDTRMADVVDKPVAKRAATTNKAQGFNTSNKPNIFRGRVQDVNNAALPFANITNTKDNVGTYSDANGNFILTSPDSVMNVQVRSLGYNNSNVVLRNNPSGNNIVLQDDTHPLTEIVVSNRNANSIRARSNTMVFEEPEPVDGWENYDTYIANNLMMTDILKSKATSGGQVELSFDVDKDGRPVNITVTKSLCDSCDKEAIRLVKEGPRFKQKTKRKGRTSVTVSF